ncbi:hypothetical protein GW915_00110 [bacterium]|nr:hypothetical protein [bacterium]
MPNFVPSLGLVVGLFLSMTLRADEKDARSFIHEYIKSFELMKVSGRMMSSNKKATKLGDLVAWVDFKKNRLRFEYKAISHEDSFGVYLVDSKYLQATGKDFKYVPMELKEKGVLAAFAQLLFGIHEGKAWKNVIIEQLFAWESKFSSGTQTVSLVPAVDSLNFKKADFLFTDTGKLYRVAIQSEKDQMDELYISSIGSQSSKNFPIVKFK